MKCLQGIIAAILYNPASGLLYIACDIKQIHVIIIDGGAKRVIPLKNNGHGTAGRPFLYLNMPAGMFR